MMLNAVPRFTGPDVETVSPADLYQVLVGACSQDISQIQQSGQRLKQMLEMFGTYDALQEIATQRNTPLSVKQQAIIQFKNAIANHWRSRKLLSDTHRTQIRQRCLSFLDEDDETIAECNEVVVAKLARTDYPQSWPNLLNTLFETIDSSLRRRYVMQIEDAKDTLRLRRSLKLLNRILKEFASIKMPSGIKTMSQIVGQLKNILHEYYSKMSITFSSEALTPQSISSQATCDNILLSHLVFKCLVKMGVWLWAKNDRLSEEGHQQNQTWIQEYFQNSVVQLEALVELRKPFVLLLVQEGNTNDQFRRTISMLTRHLRLFGKFFRRMQQLSHERFISLPTSSNLILFYWAQVVESTNYPQDMIIDSDEAVYPVRFLVQGMVLFKESLSQWTALKRNGKPNINTLSREFVENAVRLLVTRFMTLNPGDLETWVADPEEWMNVEDRENDQWEYEIRPCGERVLMQLCNQFSEYVVPLLKMIFDEIAPQSSTDLPHIVAKEAVYCAIGRCAIRLKDTIPFDEWLEHSLLLESKNTNPNYPIIKRRIAWLLGEWVSASCTSPNNPRIWETLCHLLKDRSTGSDTVVRLTAAAALRNCIDALTLDTTILAPYLPTIVPEMIHLMGEADTLESKRKVDESLNVIIEQSGQQVLPFMSVITEPIPRLWMSAGGDLLFKGSLLVTVTKLIEAVKEHSTPLSGLVVPLIRESLSPGVIIQLDADCLELWITALRNTVSITRVDGVPGLRDILPDAIAMLSDNLDLLGSITRIMESYFLLDASFTLTHYAAQLFQAYLAAFNNKILDLNAKELLQSLNLLITLTPSNLWAEALHTSGLFPHLLKTLGAGEADTIVLTEHIYLFSRIVMVDRQMFMQLISASASVLGQKETVLYDALLDQWWGKFDNMSEPRHRKLTAMGIASLVSTGRPEVLRRLSGEIFNLWLDVFGEIKEATEQAANRDESEYEFDSSNSLVRYWELEHPPESYFRGAEGTPEYARRKSTYTMDPIRTVQLVSFVGSHLQEAESHCGIETFQSYLSSADPAVLRQIQDTLAQG